MEEAGRRLDGGGGQKRQRQGERRRGRRRRSADGDDGTEEGREWRRRSGSGSMQEGAAKTYDWVKIFHGPPQAKKNLGIYMISSDLFNEYEHTISCARERHNPFLDQSV